MKNFILNGVTFFMVAIMSIGFGSCSNDDDENKPLEKTPPNMDVAYNYFYNHLEGRYEGMFEDIYTDEKFSGYVDISKLPEGDMYRFIGVGGEDIAIAGDAEFWTKRVVPWIRFTNNLDTEKILFWSIDARMWLSDTHNGNIYDKTYFNYEIYFSRWVMGDHIDEPRCSYFFNGRKIVHEEDIFETSPIVGTWNYSERNGTYYLKEQWIFNADCSFVYKIEEGGIFLAGHVLPPRNETITGTINKVNECVSLRKQLC